MRKSIGNLFLVYKCPLFPNKIIKKTFPSSPSNSIKEEEELSLCFPLLRLLIKWKCIQFLSLTHHNRNYHRSMNGWWLLFCRRNPVDKFIFLIIMKIFWKGLDTWAMKFISLIFYDTKVYHTPWNFRFICITSYSSSSAFSLFVPW